MHNEQFSVWQMSASQQTNIIAFASTLFLSYSPNSTRASTYFFDILAKLGSFNYPIFIILAKFDSRESQHQHETFRSTAYSPHSPDLHSQNLHASCHCLVFNNHVLLGFWIFANDTRTGLWETLSYNMVLWIQVFSKIWFCTTSHQVTKSIKKIVDREDQKHSWFKRSSYNM